MDDRTVISVKNVFKSFKIPHERQNYLKSFLINFFKKRTFTQYDAARDISFEVKRGEFLGIVGRNGCGKSTMLKMLAGIYRPDKGTIQVDGSLSPFLELGVGFNPELSARDNVYLNGAMLGLSKKEIGEKFDEIIAFAELEEFIDQKLKNFSSGMQVRLAFSVAIQAHSDILLIDEVLAVGDTNFQAKCNRVFHRLKKEGRTIVFVTHSMGAVSEYCDRVILLKDGKIFKEGVAKDVIVEYEKLNFESEDGSILDTANWGSMAASVTKIRYIDNGSDLAGSVKYQKPFGIEFTIDNIGPAVIGANLAVEIFKMDGTKCFGAVTNGTKATSIKLANGKNKFTLRLDNNNLVPGDYYIDFRLFENLDLENILHARAYAAKFKILGDSAASGVADLWYSWSITK